MCLPMGRDKPYSYCLGAVGLFLSVVRFFTSARCARQELCAPGVLYNESSQNLTAQVARFYQNWRRNALTAENAKI